MNDFETNILPHLRTQFERGRAILFTGAGFSTAAKNIAGENLPTRRSLSEKVWAICFPSEPFDERSSLQDIYQTAQARNPKALKELLLRSLTVAPETIEEWQARYFGYAWHRIYTLNLDDLATAAATRFSFQRTLAVISGTDPSSPKHASGAPSSTLEVVYINGTMADILDNVTFSSSHYAQRLASPDPIYLQVIADLVSRPIVFIGTSLDEPSLWLHVEIRRSKGRDLRELRPRSYLVTPSLDKAREARLSEFNIYWIKMTAEEFSNQVLTALHDANEAGLRLFKSAATTTEHPLRLPEVADLATTPTRQSEFLLGQQPIWADIQSSRAVERSCDANFWDVYQSAISSTGLKGIIVITGTAGSGKSTSLMRLVLRGTASGVRIAWIDSNSNIAPRNIISGMQASGAPDVLAIDDADMFGWSASAMLRGIACSENNPLIIVAVRSGRVDRVINASILGDLPVKEISVPHLADPDIDALIEVLDRENRLGALKGKSLNEQRKVFQEFSGRQLLVAMISATSGQKFQEKVPDEFFQLSGEMKRVYALIALGTTFRYPLTRQDILIALNDSTNEALNTIETLLNRHIIIETYPGSGCFQARHRVIAELVRDELQKRGQLTDAIIGLAFLAATHIPPGAPRRVRASRLLRYVINHEFLYRTIGLDASQSLYRLLEDLLSGDPHYWLQRGSIEVEFGDVQLAENFLSQARGILPDDLLIENEWAYLLFKKALWSPGSAAAKDLVREATDILEAITLDPRAQPHPFHVLGSQGLAWSRCGIIGKDEKARYLRELVTRVEVGIARYPKNPELKQLREDLRREYYMLAT